jgi:hypothetical protein
VQCPPEITHVVLGHRTGRKRCGSRWRYRLTVRTDGSQPSNRGSIPRTATRLVVFLAFVVAWVSAIVLAAGASAAQLTGSFTAWIDHPAIAYRTRATTDLVAKLMARLDADQVKLKDERPSSTEQFKVLPPAARNAIFQACGTFCQDRKRIHVTAG